MRDTKMEHSSDSSCHCSSPKSQLEAMQILTVFMFVFFSLEGVAGGVSSLWTSTIPQAVLVV